MKRTIVRLAFLAVAAVTTPLALMAPAAAHDGRVGGASQTSVFPQPRDPWRSWGVRSELPARVGAPRAATRDGFEGRQARDTVWVPGHWAWDGATWVWWPGHWGVR